MVPRNIVVTPTTPDLNFLKDGPLVAGRALKCILYLAKVFIFSFHLTCALASEFTVLLVEQWVKSRPGGCYLMGGCINGEIRIHFNKSSELKSETRYSLSFVGGIKPLPPS